VEAEDGNVRLVDFEHAEEYDEGKAQKELESLTAKLTEETGRGGVVMTGRDDSRPPKTEKL
jgi:hypothetical protein